MTADELLRMPQDGWRYELVDGELQKMSPSGARHARIAARIIIRLGYFTEAHNLGAVYSSEAGFKIARTPDTVLAPDVAFVRRERVIDTSAFFDGPPDVAFEVVSPSDTYTEVEEKTKRWLQAGTRVVVIVEPRSKTVRVHRSSGSVNVTDVVTIDDLLPGWQLPLAEIFA
jgi:Uma2 family endonuclease